VDESAQQVALGLAEDSKGVAADRQRLERSINTMLCGAEAAARKDLEALSCLK
jgi:hypothetical protein